MKVAVLTPEELHELVTSAVRAELAKVRPEPESEIMTCEQVAELLGVHTRTVRHLIRDEGLPPLRRIGKLWRFRRSDVLAWMANRKKSA